MPHLGELHRFGHFLLLCFDFGIVKLENFSAIQTNDMVVVFLVVGLVNHAPTGIHERLPENLCVGQNLDVAINGGGPNARIRLHDLPNDVLGTEVAG